MAEVQSPLDAALRTRAGAGTVRAVIADDEISAREALLTMLEDEPGIQVVAQAANGREAVEVIRRLRPDLLFLDIQMPDKDGFRVLEELGSDVPRGVVFVTAHDEHAMRAFDVHALDYVLKPFGRPRFRAAVARALERLSALDALTLQRTLASMADARKPGADAPGSLSRYPAGRDPRDRSRRLAVRTGPKVVLVDVEKIDWIEACGDYVRMHVGTQTHLISERMHALENLLHPDDYVRIHRSLIVRLKRIQELYREVDGGGTIVLENGVRLRVARSRWDVLENALGITER
jgi:two-component system LytT family response regulator